MADQPKPPILLNPIPAFIANVGAAFGTVDFKKFIKSPNEISGRLRFSAQLTSGQALPDGVICTESGLLNGLIQPKTEGVYDILLTVENDSEVPLLTQFKFTIKERIAIQDPNFLNNLKSQVWQALAQNMPVPQLAEMINRPISAVEIYYLLERFAVLTIWDIYNLEPAGDKAILTLPEASEHYVIYDRGSCLVGAPKDLFSHERNLEDTLQTARVMAREVYRRGWTIEFAGFNKMIRAAWVELQVLSAKHGKKLDILHYEPTAEDIKLYAVQSQAKGPSL